VCQLKTFSLKGREKKTGTNTSAGVDSGGTKRSVGTDVMCECAAASGE
jgi:hypothetical protein